jgi:hypothetical protein
VINKNHKGDQMKNKIEIKENTVIKEIKGRMYAIRYCYGMTEAEIRESMANNPPDRNEWRPYNEVTGTFTDM